MARSVNCLGKKKAVQVHLIGAKSIVQVKKVKRRTEPFQRKSLQTKQEQQHNTGAQPVTATRNPPARLPGARAEKTKHHKQEASKTDLGTVTHTQGE